MKFKAQGLRFSVILSLVASYSLLITLIGCEAFVRKFTRKPKEQPKEEMVIAPQEYKGPNMTKEQLYRQYFLFWKSWQDELISSLNQGGNHKKQVSTSEEALKNLNTLKVMLNTEEQKRLQVYITQLSELRDAVVKDIYGISIALHRQGAERIKRNILHDFPYTKIKDFLI